MKKGIIIFCYISVLAFLFSIGIHNVCAMDNSSWTATMSPKKVTITVGEKTTVKAEQTGRIRVKTLPTYISSDKSIATVDKNGVVKGIKPGVVTITGKYGKLVAGKTKVTVKEKKVWEGVMEPTEVTITVGNTTKVKAKQTGNIRIKTLPTYTSSDTSIATVDGNGVVKGKKPGVVTITGKYGKLVAGKTRITVKEKEEWTGVMEPTEATITVGNTTKVVAKQTGNIRIKTLPTYTSSDTSIATVDKNGVVKGIKPGVVTITGRYGNDDKYIAGITKVTVKEKEVWSCRMECNKTIILVGDTTKVIAKQTGNIQVNTLPTYISSDESIATVDKDGVVKGIKVGEVTITGKFGKLHAGDIKIKVINSYK